MKYVLKTRSSVSDPSHKVSHAHHIPDHPSTYMCLQPKWECSHDEVPFLFLSSESFYICLTCLLLEYLDCRLLWFINIWNVSSIKDQYENKEDNQRWCWGNIYFLFIYDRGYKHNCADLLNEYVFFFCPISEPKQKIDMGHWYFIPIYIVWHSLYSTSIHAFLKLAKQFERTLIII